MMRRIEPLIFTAKYGFQLYAMWKAVLLRFMYFSEVCFWVLEVAVWSHPAKAVIAG